MMQRQVILPVKKNRDLYYTQEWHHVPIQISPKVTTKHFDEYFYGICLFGNVSGHFDEVDPPLIILHYENSTKLYRIEWI